MVRNQINNAEFTLATTSQIVSEQIDQGKRAVLVLTNSSTAGETIGIGVGVEAVLGKGLFLKPGQVMAFSMDGSYIPPKDRIHAVASGATAKLSLYEERYMEY